MSWRIVERLVLRLVVGVLLLLVAGMERRLATVGADASLALALCDSSSSKHPPLPPSQDPVRFRPSSLPLAKPPFD